MRVAWLTLLPAWGCLADGGDSLRVVPPQQPLRFFAGSTQAIPITFCNEGSNTVEAHGNLRVLQTTSATAVLISDTQWKTLKVLPGQTVLESANVEFPSVRAETRFAVQWAEGTNRVVVVTQVLAYPTNLLQELRALVGEEGRLGVFDPADQLKPLLRSLRVEFEDLEDSGVASFRGQLAILGPFPSKADVPEDLTRRVQKIAAKGGAAVWMQPPPGPRDKLQPSFVTVAVGTGTVVVVQNDLIAELAVSPQSQLNLIHCCRIAARPESARLPDSNR